MPYLTYRPNLLDRTLDSVSFFAEGRTLRQVLENRFGSVNFELPTYVEVNGTPWLRAKWDNKLPSGSSVTVCVVPGAIAPAVFTAIAVASLLASAYVLYRISELPSISDAVGAKVPSKDPSFTFEGQKNVQRLNDVVDVTYGRLRWWPAYLCAPYVTYKNNKPTLFMLLSLGKGNYEIEDVRVNDTSLTSFAQAFYTQHDSGYAIPVDGPCDLVYYAEEFRSTELNGSNESEHITLGPYKLNPANTEVEKVLLNFRYPGGLYGITPSTGAIVSATCEVTVTLTELDSAGNNTGGSQTFEIAHSFSTTKPLRITEELIPTDASFTGTNRYAVSAVRTNAKNTSTSGQDQCEIESAFAIGHSLRQYPSSILYVQIPGTTIVGQNAAEKVNVVATRKLRKLVDGTWQAYAPCRDAVWAIVDMLQQEFGGNIPDEKLDLVYWEQLAKENTASLFDFRFEQATTLWSAITAVATSMRARPYRVGSDIRLAIDSPVALPVCIFTPDTARDLEIQMAFQTTVENDCIEAAYIDADTGVQDSIFFTPPGSSAVNPTKITFAGVTDRETAWHLAAYTYLQRSLLRDNLKMSTGLDGTIPVLGDVILVSWPFPSWSSAGVVLASDGGFRLEISESTELEAGWIALRKPNGSSWGPVRFTCTETSADGNPVVTLEYEPPAEFVFDGSDRDLVAYTLGDATTTTQRFQVTDVSPSGNSVNIEAVAFNPSIFSYDSLSVPVRGDDMLPYPSSSHAIPWLRLLEESGQYLRVEVGPVYGSPTSVVCTFAYFPFLPAGAAIGVVVERLAQIQRPWDVFGTGSTSTVETAQAEGASFYIPRRTGYLIVRVVATMPDLQVFTTWWRGCPGVFEDTDASVPFVFLVNNCDGAYVAPGNIGNLSLESAQGVALVGVDEVVYTTTGPAILDTNTGKIVLASDAPPAFGMKVGLVAKVGATEVGRIFKTVKDVGPVTFTADELRAAGLQGSETAYPTLQAFVYHTGADNEDQVSAMCNITPKPLVTSPVLQTLVHTYLGKSVYVSKEYFDQYGFTATLRTKELVNLYKVSLTETLSGTDKYKFTIAGQCNNGFQQTNIIDTIKQESSETIVRRITCVHLDTLTNMVQSTSSSGAIEFSAKMRFGNKLWSQYTQYYNGEEDKPIFAWACEILDENFDMLQVTPSSLPVGTPFNFMVMTTTHPRISQSSGDLPDSYSLYAFWGSGVASISTEEADYIIANAKYIVFVDQIDYTVPSISTTGWGEVKCKLIDFLGYGGNETIWHHPTEP